jgi:hypothetical protein
MHSHVSEKRFRQDNIGAKRYLTRKIDTGNANAAPTQAGFGLVAALIRAKVAKSWVRATASLPLGEGCAELNSE